MLTELEAIAVALLLAAMLGLGLERLLDDIE